MKEKSHTQKFFENSIWSFLISIVDKAGGLILTVVLARFLLPEGFGLYSFVFAISAIFMAFGDLGVNKTLLTFFSKEYKKDKGKAMGDFNFLFKIKIVSLSAISILLIVFAYLFSAYFYPDKQIFYLLVLSAFYIFFFSLAYFFVSFFYIYGKTKLDLIKETIFQIVLFIILFSVFYFLPKSQHLPGVFYSLIVASAIMLIYSFIFAKKLEPLIFKKVYKPIDKKRILKFLFYVVIGSLSLILFSEADIFILGLLIKDTAFLGYYRAAFSIVLGVSALFGVGTILLPILSSFSKKRATDAFARVLRYNFIFTIPATAGMLALGRYFLKIFGNNYFESTIPLYILSFLIISETFSNLFDSFLSSNKQAKPIAKALLISLVVNIGLNILLISYLSRFSMLWATAGAAFATVISRYLFMFLLISSSRKISKIPVKISYILKPLVASIIMYIVIYLITKNVTMNLVKGFFLIALGIAVYLAAMILIKGINKEDFALLSMLKSNFRKNSNN